MGKTLSQKDLRNQLIELVDDILALTEKAPDPSLVQTGPFKGYTPGIYTSKNGNLEFGFWMLRHSGKMMHVSPVEGSKVKISSQVNTAEDLDDFVLIAASKDRK